MLTEVLTQVPFDPIAVIPGIVVGLISLGFIGMFVRAATGRDPATSAPFRTVAGRRDTVIFSAREEVS